jgi:4-hydroxy-tetrahydrodipicolinate synthase
MCPFLEDYSVDEEGLAAYLRWIISVGNVEGVVTNGHTGEIMTLRNAERARVTEIAVQAVGDNYKVVSGVCAEGCFDAIDQALALKEVGADAILLMPPHHWLRFGRTSETAVNFVREVARQSDMPIIVHQYPAWTKSGYSLEEMIELTRIPQVVSIKLGTRDMSRQRYDYLAIKQAAPHVSVLTCHDEYLLASLLEGADGALVGFGGYAPDLISELVRYALAGDLDNARRIRERIDLLCTAIYEFGEPTNDAHQRMKMAAYLTGRITSPLVRLPMPPLKQDVIDRMVGKLAEAGETITRDSAVRVAVQV